MPFDLWLQVVLRPYLAHGGGKVTTGSFTYKLMHLLNEWLLPLYTNISTQPKNFILLF